jgi:hypothetical protein
MEAITTKNGLFQLLGVAFFVQALTSLLGGAVFFGPFVSKENINITMSNMANNISTIYGSVLLQIVTAVVIIILGVAMYLTAGHINKTMAMIALSFYIFEAVLLAVSQIFIFGLVEASQLYLTSGDAGLVSLGNVLLSCRDFTGKMAIIPFGLGAILFYYLLMKAKTIPKWLALWGLVTVPFVLVGVPLMAFGVTVPFALFIPYVPFEFFTGIYILIRYRKKIILKTDR